MPFSEHDNTNHPLSVYAASKKSNELMAHAYSHLYQLPTTGLRFFTVYGPWGRPDMALFKFTKNILDENPIDVFNSVDILTPPLFATKFLNMTAASILTLSGLDSSATSFVSVARNFFCKKILVKNLALITTAIKLEMRQSIITSRYQKVDLKV
jgi:hypothetical protein